MKKKKNTTDQDIEKAKTKAAAQGLFNKYKADRKVIEEAREKKISKLVDDMIENGASDSEIQKMMDAYDSYQDTFFLNEQLKKSDK